MLLAPGPTEMDLDIKEIGSSNLPYFRGKEYAETVLSMTKSLQALFQTNLQPLTVTGSGTAGMEMAIVNLFNPGDKVVSINAGTFGNKWRLMAEGLGLIVEEITVAHGQHPDYELLVNKIISDNIKGVLLTGHETSTGYAFDIEKISGLLVDVDVFIIVDGVSSIGADPFNMSKWGIDCAISCSQKTLACMPGLTFVAFSEKAITRIYETKHFRSYLDARIYLENIPRGMLPFTPAMHATMQVNHMLNKILDVGLEAHIAALSEKAACFRDFLNEKAGLNSFPLRPSNAMSAIALPSNISALSLINRLEKNHNLILPRNPTGADDFIRVSHMGNLTKEDLIKVAGIILEEIKSMEKL